jgi:hypothetical protein
VARPPIWLDGCRCSASTAAEERAPHVDHAAEGIIEGEPAKRVEPGLVFGRAPN